MEQAPSKIIPVDMLGSHRRKLTSSIRSQGLGALFDPRPTSFRDLDITSRLEKLRCDLLGLNLPCALLNILIPSIAKIEHDHIYCKLFNMDVQQLDEVTVNTNTNNSNSISADDCGFIELEEKTTTAEKVLESLYLTPEERISLEMETRSQRACAKWYEVRRVRITGSKCGRLISQKERTVSLYIKSL